MRDRKAPALLLVAAFILAAVFGALLGWSVFFPCVRSLIFPGGIIVLQKGQWMVEMGEQPLLLLSASCVMMNPSGSGWLRKTCEMPSRGWRSLPVLVFLWGKRHGRCAWMS
ncbi:hypothetical protein A4V05_10700 [Akkermansia muciniphila]|nr:hypothetical protein A4V05_10700 [Akkermansia muciniphila]